MNKRIVALSSLIATAAGAIVAAGPALLVPAPGSPLVTGPGPSSLAISDFNNDHLPDLVVGGTKRQVMTF